MKLVQVKLSGVILSVAVFQAERRISLQTRPVG